ncbi:MAG: hypothetical protein OHK93_006448 [Ramalina farinacea]|uniref:Putative lipoate-protein ligase A n=1 Tax=Ramalina farinacea TaxID=258253 RepID=A0AA43QIL6_9LECA|nr:hypothetical protein [Ramalina farinacea]
MSVSRWASILQKAKHQVYISRSNDPFVNLSIEHHLLQNSPIDSVVLFLYVNRPCVVIGRNQNPWLEINLKALKAVEPPIDWVRRRSGGGAVFHDEGNVNYSVICPSSVFTRDKHVEMVTRAIRKFNDRARVNERYDIVLDQGPWKYQPIDTNDTHISMYSSDLPDKPSLKVSGSAYKLTRQRALHHGTCLLDSTRIRSISEMLRSPARPFLKARGVESVRSPVGNVLSNRTSPESRFQTQGLFMSSVIDSFTNLYRIQPDITLDMANRDPTVAGGQIQLQQSPGSENWLAGFLDEGCQSVPEVEAGLVELRSTKWLYGQTPQFTLSSHSSKEDDRPRPPLPADFPPCGHVHVKAAGSVFIESHVSLSDDEYIARQERESFDAAIKGKHVHEISNFGNLVYDAFGAGHRESERRGLTNWLNEMFAVS